MNAYEIIRNIIPEGISQSKMPIWERLNLPDFDEVDPRDNFIRFDNAEEFLECQLKDIILNDLYLEIEYYALKPLMNEEEFEKASDEYHQFIGTYFNYKSKWYEISESAKIFEKSRNEVSYLFENNILDLNRFNDLDLSTFTQNEFERICDFEYKFEGKPSELLSKNKIYNNYYFFMRGNLKKEEMKNEILRSIEDKWRVEILFHFRYHFPLDYIDKILWKKEKMRSIKANYVSLWNSYLENHKEECQIFDSKQKRHLQKQENRQMELEELESGYLNAKPISVAKLCENILAVSDYSFDFEKSFEIDFNPENEILLIEFGLPNIDDIPKMKEVKFLTSKKEFRKIEVPQRDLSKLFDDACYSIALRSIYEIFNYDTSSLINAINFNGWVKAVNKATGKIKETCILSLQVKRDEFFDINLRKVEPKLCFKHFGGVGSSKLSGITAIQPILQIKKEDKRFVASQNVEVDNSTNLAIMNWEDFEHLIRELFEKEFRSTGGEVQVTQASRDGGVDAIAFDPDPIRGGKIVIQAKRYSNTVGVSSVRDLYGTVLNEGANKGILVTTSDYGSDSYEFAKGKPLTLLNGSHLLYLLEKHGTRARIDLNEAKEIIRSNK